ncbi:MAG: hypothetical protein CML68_16260 [Rhodobacteraceae bacterium]|nr:hypothetical protein [Paracoccaceae bacterium]
MGAATEITVGSATPEGVGFLTMMKKGDLIGTIVNIFGDEMGRIIAPEDGMFFGLRALANINSGDWCCFFCKVQGERPIVAAT